MNVDIFLTGATGFVGRFVLLELLQNPSVANIAVLIRPSGKKTAQQRFHSEIVGSSLFAPYATALRERVHVISAALENIESTTHQLAHAKVIIHCAANVKHYDPYEVLERDNVGNVGLILKLAESLTCKRLILLSTCYVHPLHGGPERKPERITGPLVRRDFYNDYCYTKWLGEERVFETPTTIPYIQILRLSCVGAPISAELRSHPVAGAAAHLGLMSLIFRGYLRRLHVSPTARISVIPVDLVAQEIVERAVGSEGPEGSEESVPQIAQLCADSSQVAFHMSVPNALRAMTDLFGVQTFTPVVENTPAPYRFKFLPLILAFSSRLRKSMELHEKVQEFVETFTGPDIRFQSSIAPKKFSAFGQITEEDMIRHSAEFSRRISAEHQFAKPTPISYSDRFWLRLGKGEPVQGALTFQTPVAEDVWNSEIVRRIWSIMSGYRKTLLVADATQQFWKQPDTPLVLANFIAPPISGLGDTEASILEYGLGLPALEQGRLWHFQPFVEDGKIRRVLVRFDHGMTDGVGGLAIIAEISKIISSVTEAQTKIPPLIEEKPQPHMTPATKFVGFWADLWMGVAYLFILGFHCFKQMSCRVFSGSSAPPRSQMPTVGTATWNRKKHPTFSFTTDLLWRIVQNLARHNGNEGRREFLISVPAAAALPRQSLDSLQNDFVPILLPLSADMTPADFAARCAFLRAKSVRFLTWCIQQLLERGQFEGILDGMFGFVDCVVSSLNCPVGISGFESISVCTTTPAPIRYGCLALTMNNSTFLTFRSHNPNIGAQKIVDALVAA